MKIARGKHSACWGKEATDALSCVIRCTASREAALLERGTEAVR